jgi:uncharacterized repeat protein (TIGR01451 family)
MNKLKVLGVLLTLALVTTKAMALGTIAGTSINNTATVNYNVGASSLTATSTQVTIKVQELINATLESKNAGKQQTVAPGQANAALSFELTNTGNGDEAFVLTQQNLTGDQFDTIADNIYVDDGDGIFEPLIDAIYVPTPLAPEESIALWIASRDISNTQNNGDGADILVNALSKTFSDAGNSNPAQGDTVAGQGDDSTDAIHAISGPANDTATFVIDNSAINMVIEKSIVGVRDGITLTGNQYIPGSEVDYLITVEVTGTGDATAVTVSDPLPIELKLKNESTGVINIDGNPNTANISDLDDASYDANTRTITVQLGDITAGDAIKNITFTTVIQ